MQQAQVNRTKHVWEISNRVDIPKPGQATAGGLDELLTVSPPGYKVTRIGWSGHIIPNRMFDPDRAISLTTVGDIRYVTTDVSAEMYEGSYGGMSNGYFWPLLHYRPDIAKENYAAGQGESNGLDDAKFIRHYRVYMAQNELYANVVTRLMEQDYPDLSIGSIRVPMIAHDYHLIPFAAALRRKGVEAPLGFFLHSGTINASVIEDLDGRQQKAVYDLLDQLHAYDLMGVHTTGDFESFSQLLDPSSKSSAQPYQVRSLSDLSSKFNRAGMRLGVFPAIGKVEYYIEQAKIWENAPETLAFLDSLSNGRDGREVDIVSLDRLDYTKGIPNKYTALGICMNRYGVKPDQIKFLQVAPFGRDMITAYQREKATVEQGCNMLNDIFSHVADLVERKVQREIMLGVFRKAKVGLVTPLADGMNLVAIEFICAQDPENPAPLVLSNKAGVASVLQDGAILVDPMRPEDIARGIMQAKRMSLEERKAIYDRAMQRIMGNTNQKWRLALVNETIAAHQARVDATSRPLAYS